MKDLTIIDSDSGTTLIVHPGWDRDGEMEIEMMTENGPNSYCLYLNQDKVEKLRDALNKQLKGNR